MTHNASAWKSRFPLLHQFFRGYLHQDFPEEYGSIAGALRQYRTDAGSDEFSRFSDEWTRFTEETSGMPAAEVDQLLSGELGGSWHIASTREVARFSEAVAKCAALRAS